MWIILRIDDKQFATSGGTIGSLLGGMVVLAGPLVDLAFLSVAWRIGAEDALCTFGHRVWTKEASRLRSARNLRNRKHIIWQGHSHAWMCEVGALRRWHHVLR